MPLFILAFFFTNYANASCGINATVNGVRLHSTQVRTIFCQGEVAVLAYYSTYPLDACNHCNRNAFTTWSNGLTGDSISVTSSGTYIAVEHQDTSTASVCGFSYPGGIIYRDTFNIVFLSIGRPVVNPGISQTLPGCGSDTLGGMPTITSGNPPYTIVWSPTTGIITANDIPNPVVTDIYSPVTYTLIVTDSMGCTDTGRVTVTPLLTTPITPPVVTKSGCQLSCQIEPNFTYQWYHNDNLVSGATSPTYFEDSTGNWKAVITSNVYPLCHISSNYVSAYPYSFQRICVVTLDSTNTYNMVVWEKAAINDIAKFRIYKQSDSTSQFILIGEQPYGDFSTYIDTTSNPSQLSASYKISNLDSCGNESTLSYVHTTILLSSNLGINNTVNLSWNAYHGFTYNNFEIWRSGNGGPMTQLATVSNTTLAYVDNNPPAQAYYQVRVTNPNGCNPSRSAFDYSTVRSNIVNNPTTGIHEINEQTQGLLIFPNPSTGSVNLKLRGQYEGPAKLIITDVLGRVVKEQPVEVKSGGTLNISLTSKGTYFMQLITTDGIQGRGIVTIQ